MGHENILGEILIVEDNPGDVRLIEEKLKETDLDPALHVVSDGPEAVAFLQQRGEYSDAPRPDLILLDLHLPRMDGEEVVEKMNSDVRDIPVIAISGSQEGAAFKLDDIEDEVAACLEKPVEPDDLREIAQSV